MTFPFAFDPRYRALLLLFGVTPGRASVEVGDGHFDARFGLWRVRTPLSNVAATTTTGPYRLVTTMGPPRTSFADRGLTFATNRDLGLCITFTEPVVGFDPTGHLLHPGLTVTVADVDALAEALA